MPHILIVEDEEVIRLALRRLLERNDYQVSEAGSVKDACAQELSDFNLIISDLRLPGAPGTDLIRLAGDVPVLIMTSYASVQSAVESMDKGAAYYVAKPFDHEEMLEKVAQCLSQQASPKNEDTGPSSDSASTANNPGNMIGSCEPMQGLYQRIHKVAPTEATVLIRGETGTGKELVAKAIHQNSRRAKRELISVNCAAIPETLIESELFGYEKGAFTGANANRAGLIEAADGGTLFLDEIGELPMEAQARLLRFIQESEIRRIGATQSQKVDVRLLCATHRDLKAMAAVGEFREDLYYRINVMQMQLPPLRERGKDVLEIAETFLSQSCDKLGHEPKRFTPMAIQAISTYTWPGNIRELENAVERAVILADGEDIDNELLDIDLKLVEVTQLRRASTKAANKRHKPSVSAADAAMAADPQDELSLEDYFQRFVLEHQDTMNETELAQKLGISRKCLWERRQRLGIPRQKANRNGKRSASNS